MDIRPADILVMKKKHPCGENHMLVLRSGMDFKLRCQGCGREFMVPRSKIEKMSNLWSAPKQGSLSCFPQIGARFCAVSVLV